MKRTIVAVALTFLLITVGTAWAEGDVGRYQVVMAQIGERKGEGTQLPILVDTKTGKVWYMGSSLAWYPMYIFSEGGELQQKEGVPPNGSYTPK